MSKLIVKKFGGTSVANPERIEAVADIVEQTINEGNRVTIVLSAMGNNTDELISLAKEINPEPDLREYDALLSTGEQVSVALLAMALLKRGIQGKSYTAYQLGIKTNSSHSRARILDVDVKKITKELKEGDILIAPDGTSHIVSSITSDTSLESTANGNAGDGKYIRQRARLLEQEKTVSVMPTPKNFVSSITPNTVTIRKQASVQLSSGSGSISGVADESLVAEDSNDYIISIMEAEGTESNPEDNNEGSVLDIDGDQNTPANFLQVVTTSGGAITAGETFTLTSTDAGATAKPTLTMLRDSASPADNDLIGNIEFKGNDSNGTQDTYVEVRGKITDVTSGTEDSTLEVVVKKDGADKTITFPSETGTLALTSDLSSSFPSGGIIMWSGAENAIPSGWVLCNGSNSTPDLRNRFVVGAGTGSNYSVGDTGGSNDATLVSHSHGNGNYGTNNTGGHSHGGNTGNSGNHAHGGGNYITNTTGSHSHRWGTDDNLGANGGNNNPDANGGQAWKAWTDSAGDHYHNVNGNSQSEGDHSHSFNTNNNGDHSHSVNGNSSTQGSSATGANRPPYYALCYIMKS